MDIKEFLSNKKIPIHEAQNIIIATDGKTHLLTSLLNEYSALYSKKYLCFSEAIQMIDDSADLKELEVLINRKFKRQ